MGIQLIDIQENIKTYQLKVWYNIDIQMSTSNLLNFHSDNVDYDLIKKLQFIITLVLISIQISTYPHWCCFWCCFYGSFRWRASLHGKRRLNSLWTTNMIEIRPIWYSVWFKNLHSLGIMNNLILKFIPRSIKSKTSLVQMKHFSQ